MKLFIDKGFLLKRVLAVAMAMLWLSCEEDRDINYSENDAIDQVILDPYLQVVTGFIPFEIGTEKYGLTFNVINGVNEVTAVKLYGSFYDAASGLTSNEVQYGEYSVDSPLRTVLTDSLTYDELKAGLTIDGNPLPDTDADIGPGSGWSFRFEGVYASGETLPLAGAINMVLSKYAGIYVVSESKYVRGVGEDFGGWDGTEVFIGFVDENTLSYNDRWGYFDWAGCSFHISIDPETGEVEVPILTDCGVFAGTGPITCQDNKNAFGNLAAVLGYHPCDVSNIIIDDAVNGAHVIKLTYGYMGANGIPRAFTETLTKVVN